MQPDTIIPGARNPAAWDRFAYTLNNPVKYNDPSGHYACGDGVDDPRCEQNDPSGPKNPYPMTSSAWLQQFIPSISQPQNGQTSAKNNNYSFLPNFQPNLLFEIPTIDTITDEQQSQGSLETAEITKDILTSGLDLFEVIKGTKLPVVSFVADFGFEWEKSSNYPTGSRLARSFIVAGEGQVISVVATGAGGLGLAGGIIPAVALYGSTSLILNNAVNHVNEQYVFLWLGLNTNNELQKKK